MIHRATFGEITRHEENQRLISTADLKPIERQFLVAMQRMAFGRFERVPIRDGSLILSPWPATVQEVRFGSESPVFGTQSGDFDLKTQVVQLFTFVRGVDVGEIRCLQIKHGLPFLMEFENGPKTPGAAHDD
jgi:hypothetical protein